MVNTGLPSRACENCRQRRVTCDYRRPNCGRCDRTGRSCTYRDLQNPELAFRIQTPASYRGRPTRPINNQTLGQQVVQSGNHPLRHDSPPRCPAEPWDVHIIPLIMSQFSFPAPDGGRFYGSLECFSTILPNMQPGSMMQFACDAVGYVCLMNKAPPSRELANRHQRAYGHALQQLRYALEDPIAQTEDDVLLAVWLLCLYELMLGTPSDAPGPGPSNWAAHSMALTGLLRARGHEQFRTRLGCQLFQLCYHHIQTCALQSGAEPDPEAKGWFETIQSTVSVGDSLYIFLPFFYQGDEAARISSKALSVWGRTFEQQEKLGIIETAFQSARTLAMVMDRSLDRIHSRSPRPRLNEPVNTRQAHHLVLHIRNHVDTCILRLDSELLNLLLETTAWPNIRPETRAHIDHLQRICSQSAWERTDRILATIPQFMPENSSDPPGWADALRLMWPARVILASPATRGSRAEAANEVLRRIAYEVGIMQAVGSYFKPVSAL
ncbi:hypothetical protein BJX64DRAFT_291871 [Aspergillus heterothallicus]